MRSFSGLGDALRAREARSPSEGAGGGGAAPGEDPDDRVERFVADILIVCSNHGLVIAPQVGRGLVVEAMNEADLGQIMKAFVGASIDHP